MTIKAISTAELHDECNGCAALNVVSVGSLYAGYPNAPNAILLPPCGGCGAITTLQGEPDNTPENRQYRFDTEQHGAINAIRALLVAADRVHPAMTPDDVARVSGERVTPPRRMMTLDSTLALVRSEAEEFPELVAEG